MKISVKAFRRLYTKHLLWRTFITKDNNVTGILGSLTNENKALITFSSKRQIIVDMNFIVSKIRLGEWKMINDES